MWGDWELGMVVGSRIPPFFGNKKTCHGPFLSSCSSNLFFAFTLLDSIFIYSIFFFFFFLKSMGCFRNIPSNPSPKF